MLSYPLSEKFPSVIIKNAFLAFNGRILFEKLNLTLPAGKWTSLLGPTGVGKSTLLRLIANLASPGTVLHADIQCDNVIDLSEQIAYMAQDDLLMPWLTVLENTLIGTKLRNHTREERRQHKESAKKLLASCGLSHAENLYPRSLSGGMRQRTALVRTIMENKPIILMDEPFSALDVVTRFKLQNLAAELFRGRTILFVTHDPVEALRLADEIYIMSGQPAKLSQAIKLSSSTPRDSATPQLVQLQSQIFEQLSFAHQAST